MNLRFTLIAAVLGLGLGSASAQSYQFNGAFTNGNSVPDGNLTGWFDTETITNQPGMTVGSVTVPLSLTGGYNGDLYMYLEHDGTLVVLANRPGVTAANPFGYADSGMNVVFSDAAAVDFHDYQSAPGYSLNGGTVWQADGRNISPLSTASAFDAAARQNAGLALALFSGEPVDGTWTLFIADTVSGGGDEQVNGWGVNLAAVPEPSTDGLIAFCALAALVAFLRRR